MAKKTKWDVIAIGGVLVIGGTIITPGLPDAELLGLALIAHGAGVV